jgi:hypothetical protein
MAARDARDALARVKNRFSGDQVNAILDAAVQLIQMGLLLILVALNVSLRRRLKAIEEKLGR